MKVSNSTIALSAESPVAVGGTLKLTETKKASKRATVAYTTSDETIAKVDSATGVVTGVKAGKATITATLTDGKVVAKAEQEVEVKNYVLDTVVQAKTKELTATVKGDTKALKPTDFTVVNTTTKVAYPVYKLAVDAKDATKVTLTLLSDLTDAANYDVTLDGTTKSFKATDGKVSSIAIDPITIPYATETDIKLVSKDANGVVLKELTTTDAVSDANYDFTITTNGNGYTNGSKLYLNKAGDTATAEISYKTGKYDKDGKPEGTIGPNKVTITAVEQSAVNTFAVRVDESGKKFDKAKETNKVALEDNTKYAYFKISNAEGKDVSDAEYNKYTIESSDNTVLMIAGNAISKSGVKLTPIKAGTAYILFKTADGKIVNSVAIDVVAKRTPAALTLDKTAVTVSNASALVGKADVEFDIKLKDQYGDDINVPADASIKLLDKDGKDVTLTDSLVSVNGSTKKVKVRAGVGAKGTYNYTVAYVKDGKTVLAQGLTVTVLAPDATISDDKDTFRLDIDKTAVDTTVKELASDKVAADYEKNITLKIYEQKAGVDYKLDTDNFTVKVYNPDGSVKETLTTTGSAITIKPVTAVASGSAIKVTKNYTPGTYKIVAFKGVKGQDTYKELNASFNVTDTQTIAPDKVVTSVTAGDLRTLVQNAVTVKYGDNTYNGASLDVVSVEAIKNGNTTKITNPSTTVASGDTFVITKLTVLVNVKTDSKNVYAEVTVPVNGAITVK
ncbi:Ig-like domain-containing protein [Roseburia faecis]